MTRLLGVISAERVLRLLYFETCSTSLESDFSSYLTPNGGLSSLNVLPLVYPFMLYLWFLMKRLVCPSFEDLFVIFHHFGPDSSLGTWIRLGSLTASSSSDVADRQLGFCRFYVYLRSLSDAELNEYPVYWFCSSQTNAIVGNQLVQYVIEDIECLFCTHVFFKIWIIQPSRPSIRFSIALITVLSTSAARLVYATV